MTKKANLITKEKIQVSNSSYIIHCKDYESTFQHLVFLKTRSTLDNNLIKSQRDDKESKRNAKNIQLS